MFKQHTSVQIIFFIFGLIGSSLLSATEMHTSHIHAIIFDCDGVLVDTEYLKFLAWKEALKVQNITFTIEEYMPLVGHSSKNILKKIRENKKLDLADEMIAFKDEKYKNLQREGVKPIQDVVNFVLFLFEQKAKLGFKLALASSAPRDEIWINLRQAGLENIFDEVISGSDDLGAYVDSEGTNKPKPYIYIEASKRLDVDPSHCLVFEDTKAGVDAAANAGMIAIALPNQFTIHQDFSNAHQVLSYKELTSLNILKN